MDHFGEHPKHIVGCEAMLHHKIQVANLTNLVSAGLGPYRSSRYGLGQIALLGRLGKVHRLSWEPWQLILK